MYRFWEPVIAPIIKSIQPQSIVEIGSDYGHNTRKLISYCQNNRAQLYVIDPLPKYDPDEWKERYGSLFHYYQSLSLNALPLIEKMDVVLIDGDHNWYTVINELRMLEKTACKNNSSFPLVFLHDISWPYGRRDLYYNPETIPVAYRKPFKKMGLMPGKVELVENGGLNSHLDNAIYENDFQGGVLTAVEDFLQETSFNLKFHAIPVFHGLGILYPHELSSIHPECDQFVRSLHFSREQDTLLAMVENEFLNSKIVTQQKRKKLESEFTMQQELNAKLNEDLKRMRHQYTAERSDQEILREQIQGKNELLKEREKRLAEVTEDNDQLSSNIGSLKKTLASLQQEQDGAGKAIQGLVYEKANLIKLLEAAFEENKSLRAALDDALEMI